MSEIPQDVFDIVKKATLENLSDIPLAIARAEQLIKALPGYQCLVDILVHDAIQDLVYSVRSKNNEQIRRSTGYYTNKNRPKISTADSSGVKNAYQSVLDYARMGKRLGDLTGDDLDQVIVTGNANIARESMHVELAHWLKSQGILGSNITVESKFGGKRAKELRDKFDALNTKAMDKGLPPDEVA